MSEQMNFLQAVAFHENAKSYGAILGLNSIRALMKELGDVWKDLKIVHIAGTNGKGSVCCFLASILREAGYLVGQYNSPAVFDLREVYQIDGRWISKAEYTACMEEVATACGRLTERGLRHPTVFEIETALAFLWFARKKCEIVLLETGMGGSTDATNLIEKPLCSVFTSISMDHMRFLGNSLGEIASVKAGIIKNGCPVVTVRQQRKVERILRQEAEEKHAAFHVAPEVTNIQIEKGQLCFLHPKFGKLRLSMTGSYQAQNAALALKTIDVLREVGYFVTDAQQKKGLQCAKWAGRFECIHTSPLFYIDGAHNEDGAKQLALSLRRQYPNTRRIGIMGVMADKPYAKMLSILLPFFEMVYTVTPDNPRALPAEILAEEIRMQKVEAIAKTSVAGAVLDACERAKEEKNDVMIVAFGSLYYLREVKHTIYEIMGNRPKNQSELTLVR